MILRALLVWIVIAVAETVHGILRVRYLNRRVGDRRARQIGVFTGSLIVLAITWLTLPWIGATGTPELIGVGTIWMVLMVVFDVALGRWLMRFRWRRIADDFDPRKGGLLGFGMVVLLVAPWMASHWR